MFKQLKKRWRRDRSNRESRTLDPVEQLRQQLPDAGPRQLETISRVQPYTMTSPQRILALCDAVEYLVGNNIPGSFVECGVWRGGSMAAAALTLKGLGVHDRRLWLYDTFDGMSAPTDEDVDCWGQDADRLLSEQRRDDAKSVWCVSALEEVQSVIASTDYPQAQVNFVVGKVEDTLPQQRPERIALLRLDTDWYESTKCELEYLFPLLEPGGVIIIDDYGHWKGCRRAVDEYLQQHGINLFLNRIDYTGRLGIKLPSAVSQPNSNPTSLSNVA